MDELKPVMLPNGQNLKCDTCRHELFEHHRWKLQTTGMTFMRLDWANRDATCFVCGICRRIHWFDW